MMKQVAFLLLGTFLIFSACKKDEAESLKFTRANLVISTGDVCGWCTGADSIAIIENKYGYQSYNPCDKDEVFVDESGEVTEEQWDALLENFDFEAFQNIDLNRCNVCADGCDRWLRIKFRNEEHKITYGYTAEDSAIIQPILPFIEDLQALKVALTTE